MGSVAPQKRESLSSSDGLKDAGRLKWENLRENISKLCNEEGGESLHALYVEVGNSLLAQAKPDEIHFYRLNTAKDEMKLYQLGEKTSEAGIMSSFKVPI